MSRKSNWRWLDLFRHLRTCLNILGTLKDKSVKPVTEMNWQVYGKSEVTLIARIHILWCGFRHRWLETPRSAQESTFCAKSFILPRCILASCRAKCHKHFWFRAKPEFFLNFKRGQDIEVWKPITELQNSPKGSTSFPGSLILTPRSRDPGNEVVKPGLQSFWYVTSIRAS